MKAAWLLFGAIHLATASPISTIQGIAEADTPRAQIPADIYVEKDVDPHNPFTPGAKVTTVRYGPYTVPSMGMLDSIWTYNLEKPCTDCYITAMQADLQYTNGKSANIDEGAWMHHIVLYSSPGMLPGSKKDLVCSGSAQNLGLPYPHRIFGSGNERSAVRLNHKYKYGMPVDPSDSFLMVYDLVNQSNKTASYYIAVNFEWLPKSTPEYKPARMVWMDVTGCGDSESPAKEGYYEIKSPVWKSSIGGRLLSSGGHTHDGGVFTTLYINDKPVCRSAQLYGTKESFKEKDGVPNLNSEMKEHGGMDMHRSVDNGVDDTLLHISDVQTCLDFGVLRPGDTMYIVAGYNSTAHSMNRGMHGMVGAKSSKLDGKYAPVMGINSVYVAEGLYDV